MKGRMGRWLRIVGPVLISYSIIGLLVEAAVPQLMPENGLTVSVGEAAKIGIFAIWFYLIWRIIETIKGIYGQQSAAYLEHTPIWRILLDITAAYVLAAFCFSVLYVYLSRGDASAFSEQLNLGNALYFSLVSMTTTGYGDILPKSGLARFIVCLQILFGFFYNVLFFSIFAGFAGRRRPS
jgi:hypothetical protein